jgi:hypothetical protein
MRHAATNQCAITLLYLVVTAGSLFAAEPMKASLPGTDDLSRYVAAKATPGGKTVLRDASGRTVGSATTVGSRTTFRDNAGRTTGTASAEGNRTVFRDVSGRNVGTGTPSGCQTTTFRDAAGRIQSTAAADSGERTTFRDASGRTTGTAQITGAEHHLSRFRWPDDKHQHDNRRHKTGNNQKRDVDCQLSGKNSGAWPGAHGERSR